MKNVRRLLSTCLIVLVGLLPCYVSAVQEPLQFGAWTQVWPWMWRDGKPLEKTGKLTASENMRWQFSLANMQQYSAAGFNWNVVVLRQGIDGPDNWARARAIVEKQNYLGIKTVFRLIESPIIYLEPLEHLDAKQGLLNDYSMWISGIAREFSDDVSFYLISNEIDHDIGHNLIKYQSIITDYPHYERLLKVAHAEIKKINPELQVVDHGVSAYSLGLAVAEHLREKQGILAAYAFWQDYHFSRPESAGSLLAFTRMLLREDSRRRIAITQATFRSDVSDYHQFHWYFSAEALPEVLDWVDVQANENAVKIKPLFVTELGYRMPWKPGKTWDGRPTNVADYSRYSQQQHAANLVKNIVFLLSRGVKHIQYWQVRMHHERDASAQLFLPTQEINEFIPTQAMSAYARIIQLLNGPVTTSPCTDGTSLYECRFETKSGVVRVLWAKKGTVSITTSTALQSVFNYAGKQIELPDKQQLSVGTEPVLLLESRINTTDKKPELSQADRI